MPSSPKSIANSPWWKQFKFTIRGNLEEVVNFIIEHSQSVNDFFKKGRKFGVFSKRNFREEILKDIQQLKKLEVQYKKGDIKLPDDFVHQMYEALFNSVVELEPPAPNQIGDFIKGNRQFAQFILQKKTKSDNARERNFREELLSSLTQLDLIRFAYEKREIVLPDDFVPEMYAALKKEMEFKNEKAIKMIAIYLQFILNGKFVTSDSALLNNVKELNDYLINIAKAEGFSDRFWVKTDIINPFNAIVEKYQAKIVEFKKILSQDISQVNLQQVIEKLEEAYKFENNLLKEFTKDFPLMKDSDEVLAKIKEVKSAFTAVLQQVTCKLDQVLLNANQQHPISDKTNIFVQNFVNINNYPLTINKPETATHVTIGDTHGNALKLYWFLIKEGVIKNVTPEQYARIAEIYNKSVEELTAEDLQSFNNILNTCDINLDIAGVRIIGDELCDRGSNDYFTLKILKQLQNKGVNVSILASNHSVDFLYDYEKNISTYTSPLGIGQAGSLFNLGKLIERGLVNEAKIVEMVETAYKPALKAIDYSYNLDINPPDITLYTHAPVGINTIKQLAAYYKVPYDDSNLQALCHTIDQINNQFALHVKHGRLLDTTQDMYMHGKKLRAKDIPQEHPLVRIMWSRIQNKDKFESEDPHSKYLATGTEHVYRLQFAHGHEGANSAMLHAANVNDPVNTPYQSFQDNMFTFDNDVGKWAPVGVYHTANSTENMANKPTLVFLTEQEIKEKLAFKEQIKSLLGQAKILHDDALKAGSTLKVKALDKLMKILQGNKIEEALKREEASAVEEALQHETALTHEEANSLMQIDTDKTFVNKVVALLYVSDVKKELAVQGKTINDELVRWLENPHSLTARLLNLHQPPETMMLDVLNMYDKTLHNLMIDLLSYLQNVHLKPAINSADASRLLSSLIKGEASANIFNKFKITDQNLKQKLTNFEKLAQEFNALKGILLANQVISDDFFAHFEGIRKTASDVAHPYVMQKLLLEELTSKSLQKPGMIAWFNDFMSGKLTAKDIQVYPKFIKTELVKFDKASKTLVLNQEEKLLHVCFPQAATATLEVVLREHHRAAVTKQVQEHSANNQHVNFKEELGKLYHYKLLLKNNTDPIRARLKKILPKSITNRMSNDSFSLEEFLTFMGEIKQLKPNANLGSQSLLNKRLNDVNREFNNYCEKNIILLNNLKDKLVNVNAENDRALKNVTAEFIKILDSMPQIFKDFYENLRNGESTEKFEHMEKVFISNTTVELAIASNFVNAFKACCETFTLLVKNNELLNFVIEDEVAEGETPTAIGSLQILEQGDKVNDTGNQPQHNSKKFGIN